MSTTSPAVRHVTYAASVVWHCLLQAIDQHDRIMRDYLSLFCGYEVTTEGDAFLVAFHEPGDAIAYCLTVQIALQGG